MKPTTFLLTGFRNEQGARIYTFDGVGPDRVRTPCTVVADMAMIRKYNIRVQELPLLCRGLLDRQETVIADARLELNEGELIHHATRLAEAKSAHDAKRAAHRKPVSSRTGLAWRTSPL